MRYFIPLVIFWCFSMGQVLRGAHAESNSLKELIHPGDVILLPLNCYSCEILESETNSPYSHSGVVIEDKNGELVVVESLGSVTKISLKNFLLRAQKNQKSALYRAYEFQKKWVQDPIAFKQFSQNLTATFYNKYLGLGFDHEYLWDNKDENGRELLYCSEFLTKILNEFLDNDFTPKPMDFSKHWNFWSRYYGSAQKIPQGKLGNSPGDFARSGLFYLVNYLSLK